MVDCLGVRIQQLEDQKESDSESNSDSDEYESDLDDEGYHEDGSGSNWLFIDSKRVRP